jgi:import inner membrane translocase subunit TIM23
MSRALYSLSDSPEFLFDEERQQKTRSWSENLTYITGAGYLYGSIAGGGVGVYHGLKSTPEVNPKP